MATEGQAEVRPSWAPPWWAVLIIGLLLLGAAIGSTFITGDVITLSTIVVLGSFLVPVVAVVWYGLWRRFSSFPSCTQPSTGLMASPGMSSSRSSD